MHDNSAYCRYNESVDKILYNSIISQVDKWVAAHGHKKVLRGKAAKAQNENNSPIFKFNYYLWHLIRCGNFSEGCMC